VGMSGVGKNGSGPISKKKRKTCGTHPARGIVFTMEGEGKKKREITRQQDWGYAGINEGKAGIVVKSHPESTKKKKKKKKPPARRSRK